MKELLTYIAEDTDGGKRLDIFVMESSDSLTRSRIKSLIESGKVAVNDKTAKSQALLSK